MAIVGLPGASRATAAEAEYPSPDAPWSALGMFTNVKARTLGGKQFWADQVHFRTYRIQKNVVTGHYRLLDKSDHRHAWGTLSHCRNTLQRIRRQKRLTPYTGKAVILLHGLCGHRSKMAGIGRYLEVAGGYHVYNVTYPTTRGNVSMHAKCLAGIIENLEGVTEINLVGHSLGNLVIRRYLAMQTDLRSGVKLDRRIGRIVMIGPPNNGAELAKRYGRNTVWEWITGESGRQLGSTWDDLEKKLATPKQPFGIIAGGGGKGSTRNPLISGDDDFVVTVEETKLKGAADFLVLPVIHARPMNDPRVKHCTLQFIKNGYFVSEERKQPIK